MFSDGAKEALWMRGNLSWKLWPQQRPIYETVKLLPRHVLVVVFLCARQFGKCLAKGTDVLTPTGPKPIEDLRAGDTVYGYNKDGSISPCKVVEAQAQGRKLVWDLGSRGKTIVSATPEHRWLARWKVGSDTDRYSYRYEEEQTTDEIINGRARKIARAFVDIPCGDVHEPHAYALGALFGDGCGKQGRNRIAISSENGDIPRKVGRILGVEHVFSDGQNFTWYLSSVPLGTKVVGGYKHSRVIQCNHYDDWIKGRLSREKTYDWSVVDSWDRASLLALLAGMIDTDGSVVMAPCGTLNIRFANTNEPLIDLFCRVFYKLFQHKPGVHRADRGRATAEYTATIINNQACSRALRQLDEHIVCERKKWRPEYDNLKTYNSKPDRIGVKKLGERYTETYDIQVDNDTNLYVLANQGLITHNSVLGVLLAVEDCLTNPDVIVMIIAPNIKQARAIVRPRMKLLGKDAPEGLIHPVKSEDAWYFANGAELRLGGFNTNSMAQRGKTIHKIYMEETADSEGDDYLDFLQSDLGPALTHSAHAQVIHLTTLPKVPDHPFVTETVPEAEMGGAFFKYTIHHNLKLTAEKYAQCVKLCGGEHTTAFKREYLCQQVRDASIILAPEFDEALHVRPLVAPDFCKFWIGGDVGGVRDMSVFHLCGYDFRRAKVLFLDERSYKPETGTAIWVADCLEMEGGRPVSRHVDVPGQLQVDLMTQHGYPCMLPRKDELEATVNQVRVALQTCALEIDPKCKLLITTLRSGTFNHNRTDLARSSTLGHMDAFMSCAYGLRHANKANPYPLHGGATSATHYIRPQHNQTATSLRGLFKGS